MNAQIILFLVLALGGNCRAAIIYPQAPEGGRQVAYANATDVLRSAPRFLGGYRIDELSMAEPYREYFVGLTNLAAGHLLSEAQSRGSWMYLLVHGTNAVGAAGLLADETTGKVLKANGLYQSDSSNETLEALRKAEMLPQTKKQNYEFRRLDIPALSFVAIWLHGKSDELIIPLPPTYERPLTAYQPYSEDQIIKVLEPEAKRDQIMWQKLDEQEQKEKAAYAQAMTDYEQAHGGQCGPISYYGQSGPLQVVAPHTRICKLLGVSSKCGHLDYQAKITYEDSRCQVVKQIEIIAKLTP